MPLMQEAQEDQFLSNIANEFGPTGHIADLVLPPVRVKLEDGKFWNYDKSKFNTPQTIRAPRTRYREIDWKPTKDSYHVEEYGLESRIDDRERNNESSPIDLEETTTEILTDNVLNGRELRIANLVLSTTYVTQNTTLSGTTQWSDYTNSDPGAAVDVGQGVIRGVTGMFANTAVMGYAVAAKLRRHPKVLAFVGGTGNTRPAKNEELAQYFGVQEILIGSVLTSTSKKGQTVTLGDVWGKHFLLFHKQPRPALRRPAFGYQMRVQELKTFRWRDVPTNCDVLRVNEIGGEILVASTLGYLFANAVA